MDQGVDQEPSGNGSPSNGMSDAQLVQSLADLVRVNSSLEKDPVIFQIFNGLKYDEDAIPLLTARQRRSARRALERFASPVNVSAARLLTDFRFVTPLVTVICSVLHGWVVSERVSEPFHMVRMHADAPWAQPSDHQVFVLVEPLPPGVTLDDYVARCCETARTSVPLAKTFLTDPEPISIGGVDGARVYYEQFVPCETSTPPAAQPSASASSSSSQQRTLSVNVDTCMCVYGSAAVTLQYVSLAAGCEALRPSFHSLVADTTLAPAEDVSPVCAPAPVSFEDVGSSALEATARRY